MGDTSIATRSEMESLATQLKDSKRYLGDLTRCTTPWVRRPRRI